ncbi:hypothetical protein ACSFXN_09355 [Planococcus sp. 1R117A]|uniref:hypothetical protein n=1 Tax=Planococcus sp. 1R117A TaxID=3447020 RepID=UPI003EDC94C8
MKINKNMRRVGDIKDRGSIKWQGMFLTEHVQMLRDPVEEDKYIPSRKRFGVFLYDERLSTYYLSPKKKNDLVRCITKSR